MKMKQLVLALAGSILIGTSSLHAIEIAGFNAEANDRYAGGADFVAAGYDLSGVALTEDGKWVTMISEIAFVTSDHFYPANGTSVTFYSETGESATRFIASSQRVDFSDLRVGFLDLPLGSEFASYDIASDEIYSNKRGGPGTLSKTAFGGMNAFIFGRSPTNRNVSQDIAVGRNVIDTWIGGVMISGTIDSALGAKIDSATERKGKNKGAIAYEAALRVGDSGAPVLVDLGTGRLTLVGTNWFESTVDGAAVNGFAYVGNYFTELAGF